jgi:hypothetical protein
MGFGKMAGGVGGDTKVGGSSAAGGGEGGSAEVAGLGLSAACEVEDVADSSVGGVSALDFELDMRVENREID